MSSEKKTLRLMRTGAGMDFGRFRYEGHADPTKRPCQPDGEMWEVAASPTLKKLPPCPGCGAGAFWSEQTD